MHIHMFATMSERGYAVIRKFESESVDERKWEDSLINKFVCTCVGRLYAVGYNLCESMSR